MRIFGSVPYIMGYRHPRKSKYNFRVRRGSSGLGLFTDVLIKKGVFVIEYLGPILDEKEADKKGGKYLFEIDKKWTIEGSARKNLARYINHSCKPNCEAEIDGKRIFIYAKKNINAGEELSYNYGKGYFEDIITQRKCRCDYCRKKRNKKNYIVS